MQINGLYSRFGKRGMDATLALLAIVLISWLLLIIVLCIRATSSGPAIFKQQRIGKDGKKFTIFKFRSMPVATGDIASDQLGNLQIGRFGQFIRRTNLDELPQLVNILRGDMAVVGPRPPLPGQVELIEIRRVNGALYCRPGLTGLAQVSSFDGMTVAQKAEFDGQYARTVGLIVDAAIILRTFAYLLNPPPTY
jgi:O-antigen biosynthesis protein WbqP